MFNLVIELLYSNYEISVCFINNNTNVTVVLVSELHYGDMTNNVANTEKKCKKT